MNELMEYIILFLHMPVIILLGKFIIFSIQTLNVIQILKFKGFKWYHKIINRLYRTKEKQRKSA